MRISTGPIVILMVFAAVAAGAVVWIVSSGGQPFTFGSMASRPADNPAGQTGLAVADASADPNLSIPPTAAQVVAGATISGRIRIEGAASMPADLTVALRPARFHKNKSRAVSKDLKVNARGEFRAEGLPYAAYELRGLAGGYSGQATEVNISQSAPFVYVDVRLVKNPDISGTLRDTMRSPIADMRVVLAGRDELGHTLQKETQTNAAGMFQFTSVPDGDYSITAGVANFPLRSPLEFQVREGVAPAIGIDVPMPSAVEVRTFVPGFDVPVEGVTVVLFKDNAEGSATESYLTGNDGKIVIKNLPPGKYVIRGTREYFRQADAALHLAEGQFEQVELAMAPLLDELVEQMQSTIPPSGK
jgi:hypothetical protein